MDQIFRVLDKLKLLTKSTFLVIGETYIPALGFWNVAFSILPTACC